MEASIGKLPSVFIETAMCFHFSFHLLPFDFRYSLLISIQLLFGSHLDFELPFGSHLEFKMSLGDM